MKPQRLPKTLYCLIAGVSFYVCPASAQLGTIINVGATVTEMDAITFNSSGVLYGATGGAGSLYTIDPTTGVATLVHAFVGASNASLTYGVNGLAFQPGTGTLYGTTSPDSPNSGDSLVTINPTTGQVTVIGPSGTGFPYASIAFAPNGTLYGWLIGSGATTVSAATVNLTTGAGTSLGSPQTPVGLPNAGGLAVGPGGVIYVAANGHAGGVCSPTQSCSGALWAINPANGAPATIGTLTGGPGVAPTITALAFSPISGVLYGIEGGDGGAGWNLITINMTAVQTIVVPNAETNSPGNAEGSLPSSPTDVISQRLFGSDQFPGPINIIGLSSFRAAPGTGPLDGTFGTVSVYLSTSPNSPTSMSTTFANNIGPDNTLVFSGTNVDFSGAGCSGPGVCPFAPGIVFTTPFDYIPANGSLLVEIVATGFTGSGQTDAELFSAPGGSLTQVTEEGSTTAATGSLSYGAGIWQFTYTPVPVILVANESGGVAGTGSIGAYTTSGATVSTALISSVINPRQITVSGSDLFVASGDPSDTIGEYTTSGVTVNGALIPGLGTPAHGVAVSGSNLFVAISGGAGAGAGTIAEYTTSGL